MDKFEASVARRIALKQQQAILALFLDQARLEATPVPELFDLCAMA